MLLLSQVTCIEDLYGSSYFYGGMIAKFIYNSIRIAYSIANMLIKVLLLIH